MGLDVSVGFIASLRDLDPEAMGDFERHFAVVGRVCGVGAISSTWMGTIRKATSCRCVPARPDSSTSDAVAQRPGHHPATGSFQA